VDTDTRQRLVTQYKDGYRAVSEALAGATERELDVHPKPGRWSAREIVHHLADSEMTSAMRLRMLVAAERPQIIGYDQDAYAARLYYDRPISASLEAFKAARATTAEILDRMSEAEWARQGTHSESGAYSVEKWLEIYAAHAHEHAKQIRAARQSVGRK
jgi:hypothetical protein